MKRRSKRRSTRASAGDLKPFARTRTELAELIAAEPFPATPVAEKQPGSAHMVVFLKRALSASEAGALEAHSTDVDTLVVRGREVHWYRKGSSLSSKLKPAHWKAIGDQPMTNRNRTMLVKLASRF